MSEVQIPPPRPIISINYILLYPHPTNLPIIFASSKRWDRRYGARIDQFALPKVGQIVRLLSGAHLDMACIDFRGFLMVVAEEALKLREAHTSV